MGSNAISAIDEAINWLEKANADLEPELLTKDAAASTDNLKWRCWSCHKVKTERDRRAGKLRPPPLEADRGPPP